MAESHLDGTVNNAGMTVPVYFNNFQCQATKNASLIADFNIFYILNKLNVTMIVHDFELNLASYSTSLPALQISKDNTVPTSVLTASSKKISTPKPCKSVKAENLCLSTISGVYVLDDSQIHENQVKLAGYLGFLMTDDIDYILTTFYKKYSNFFERTGPAYKTESSICINVMKKMKLQDIQIQISELSNDLKNLKSTKDVSAVAVQQLIKKFQKKFTENNSENIYRLLLLLKYVLKQDKDQEQDDKAIILKYGDIKIGSTDDDINLDAEEESSDDAVEAVNRIICNTSSDILLLNMDKKMQIALLEEFTANAADIEMPIMEKCGSDNRLMADVEHIE
ncbi:heat shock protein 70 [Coccidioides immitis RMSCC 2394]|uniref:Heat shock protein 70 n=1 Tax=Coccidioides immitis RMSCC 2394 TaxID=404692 RepID=A0A0J6YE84_COCIT|nr:heat shock protein 70 [Coccidioides immitis RMSCC 2394]